ncbi:MAG: HYR domain-containing protein, partial [Bacteroidota bacterium]
QNITVPLDASGLATITANDIDNGSNDGCGGAVTLSASQTSFNCTNLGTNNVTLTVLDASGNSSSCTAVVTITDTENPVAVCQPFTVQLDASGNGSLVAADIDGGSTDNCGITSRTASQTSFTCADLGTNNITLTVFDAAGNSNTCTAVVTVEDNINPVANCVAGTITINLDASGNATLTTATVDNGSTDNCGAPTLSLSQTAFTCADLGAGTVTLTASDASGNTDDCTVAINVVNPNSNVPTVITQNISIDLDASGSATITAAQVDNGSSATCGVASTSVTPSTFGCANVGTNTVTLTVTGQNGQFATGTATVTVNDVTPPTITCPSTPPAVSAAAADCDAFVDLSGFIPTANDACTPVIITSSSSVLGVGTADASGVYPVGTTTVTYTATDVNGLTATCTLDITVTDVTPPNPVCQDITVFLDGTGNATITAADIENGSTDACGIMSRTLDISSFTCADLGNNTVVMTVTDMNGLTNNCSAT